MTNQTKHQIDFEAQFKKLKEQGILGPGVKRTYQDLLNDTEKEAGDDAFTPDPSVDIQNILSGPVEESQPEDSKKKTDRVPIKESEKSETILKDKIRQFLNDDSCNNKEEYNSIKDRIEANKRNQNDKSCSGIAISGKLSSIFDIDKITKCSEKLAEEFKDIPEEKFIKIISEVMSEKVQVQPQLQSQPLIESNKTELPTMILPEDLIFKSIRDKIKTFEVNSGEFLVSSDSFAAVLEPVSLLDKDKFVVIMYKSAPSKRILIYPGCNILGIYKQGDKISEYKLFYSGINFTHSELEFLIFHKIL